MLPKVLTRVLTAVLLFNSRAIFQAVEDHDQVPGLFLGAPKSS
jgi:hypothetical protein